MTAKVCRVALSDLECVTNTIVKLGGPLWYLNIKKGMRFYPIVDGDSTDETEAIKFADKELSKLCTSWTSNVWDEMDWARIKELQVRDVLEQRHAQADIAQKCKCLQCPHFLKHVSPHPLPMSSALTNSLKCNMTSGRSRRTSRN